MEKRCPKCVLRNNFSICDDKKCCNYVSELSITYSVKDLEDFLNLQVKKNPKELLIYYIKTIILYAKAIAKDST